MRLDPGADLGLGAVLGLRLWRLPWPYGG